MGIIFIGLLIFQIYLNISAYYAVVSGMNNFSLFIIGLMMLVFAGMFHIYRHGRAMKSLLHHCHRSLRFSPEPLPFLQRLNLPMPLNLALKSPVLSASARAKPLTGSSPNPKSSSLGNGGQVEGRLSKEAGNSQDAISSTKMDNLDKPRNGRVK